MGLWVAIEEELPFHPKTAKMRRYLGCAQGEATGIIVAMIIWGAKYTGIDGFFTYEQEEDLGRYLQYANPGSKLSPEIMVKGLKVCGWIDTKQEGMYFHDWETWQSALYKAKERREKDALRKRESRRNELEHRTDETVEEKDVSLERPADSPKDKEKSEDIATTPEEPKYTPAFSQFWDAYPRKIGKGEAYKKYVTRRKDGFSDEELLIAAKNYAIQVRKQKTDKQYIKHPKTFLSDTTPFVDYIPKKPETPKYDETPVGENPFKNWEDGN